MSAPLSTGPGRPDPAATGGSGGTTRRRRRRWPLVSGVCLLVALTFSAWVVVGLNIWETRSTHQLRADLERVNAQKARDEAAALERLRTQALDFCARADLATENSIEGLVSEYYSFSTEVTMLVDGECSEASFLIAHWQEFDGQVQAAFSPGRCEQDGWGVATTLDGSLTNPLVFPIDVTISGNVTSGGTTIGTGTGYLTDVQPGESRRVSVYVPTGGVALEDCSYTDVTWWPSS